MIRNLLILLLLGPVIHLSAQEPKDKKWSIDGYLSELGSIDFSSDTLRLDNQLHNRLKFKWFPSNNLNIRLELRNRLIFGDTPAAIPQLDLLLDTGNDFFDLSYAFPKNKKWIFHSIIDRAYLEYSYKDWEFNIGRQRINWGINTVWNPNDLFNNFSFFDFDYVERPGSDAVLIKKYLGFASSIELISNIADKFDETIFGSRLTTNIWQYDFQLIIAKAKEDLNFGLGWAGNIKQAGFKGELSYFHSLKDGRDNAIAASLSFDYIFAGGLYLNLSGLYTSDTTIDFNVLGFSFANTGSVSARMLSPFNWSVFAQTSYSFNPLLRGGMAIMYFPGDRNAIFLNPSIDYSIKNNLDIGGVFQFYFDKINDDYQSLAKVFYIRLKWNF